MLGNKTIYLYDYPIHNKDDLLSASCKLFSNSAFIIKYSDGNPGKNMTFEFDHITLPIGEIENPADNFYFLRFEELHLQKCKKLPYTLKDLVEFSSLIDFLTLLYQIMGHNCYYNTNSLLKNFLNNRFDLDKSITPIISSFNERMETSLDLDDYSLFDPNLKSIEYLITTEGKDLDDHNRDDINKYINIFSIVSSCNCSLKEYEPNSDTDNERKTETFIYFAEAPFLVLKYLYDDGRDFSKAAPDRNPRRPKPYSYEKSFLLAQKTFNECFCPKKAIYKTDKLDPFLFFHLKLDKEFQFTRLSILKKYYDIYTSDTFINRIMQKLSINNSEFESVKDSVRKIVFDTNFIISGISSMYTDFFYIFDLFLESRIDTAAIEYNNDAERLFLTCRFLTSHFCSCPFHALPAQLNISEYLNSDKPDNLYSLALKVQQLIQDNTYFKDSYCHNSPVPLFNDDDSASNKWIKELFKSHYPARYLY